MKPPAEALARAVRDALKLADYPIREILGHSNRARGALLQLDKALADWEAPGGEREAWEIVLGFAWVNREDAGEGSPLHAALARLEGKK